MRLSIFQNVDYEPDIFPNIAPFNKTGCSEFINFGSEASIPLAMALVAILQSTLSKVIGRQFDKSSRSRPPLV